MLDIEQKRYLFTVIQYASLNVITLDQTISDHKRTMIVFSKFHFQLAI